MDFGTIEVEGIEYTLAGNIDFTGRKLDSRHVNPDEVADGERYDAEMEAHATDPDGNSVLLRWILGFTKGEELEPDQLGFAIDYTPPYVEYL